jgi:hypothetical protein
VNLTKMVESIRFGVISLDLINPAATAPGCL